MAKLHFYYSAMNAGKTTLLLQSSYNYKERGMDTLLYAPKIDNRYGVGKITSRIGLQAKSVITADKNFDFYESVRVNLKLNPKLSCILVDEAHFLTREQIFQLAKIVDKLDLPVLAYGLRSDFQAEPFTGSIYLLGLADNIIEVKTICHCGKKAIMNMRIDEAGNKIEKGAQVHIGGNEAYVSTCREHFFKGDSGINKFNNFQKSIENNLKEKV